MNPLDLSLSITLLKGLRASVYGESDFAWETLLHAHGHLEKQLKTYFSDEIKEAA
jgi:hypothetical protein